MREMDGRTNNLCCRVTPGLEMALAASTTAYGAKRKLSWNLAASGFAPMPTFGVVATG